ncbi:AT-rich interactive domain-containing protein 2-like [Impatiens glandulifera]|uniref:AT-rich interactive domain-containing protein 2-like n=1 Tax=Impatiens glandulifera TaxID=253017 RepID=UPI001FB15C7A|nr:AT-rich interactive domain-containing protein 2-like [Impatiens glandulifera]
MVSKRLIHDEEPNGVACKPQNHDENGAEESTVKRIVESGGVVDGKDLVSQAENWPANLNEMDYFWANGNTVHDCSEFSFVPNFVEFDRQVTTLVRPSDLYSTLMECPPRKQVPVGPDHQACIPDWQPNSIEKFDAHSQDKLMGTCVIPIPNLDIAKNDLDCVGLGRTDCHCVEIGSVECVRKHIGEARDKLKTNVGSVVFSEMGFPEMGEFVANKWREDEELAFHEIVISNRMSMGKNFWHHLPTFFPSKKTEELVSYYFNAFMLRKRADQNRHDPINIDSDNDEWEKPVEAEDDDEDEDSHVMFRDIV